MNGSYWIKGTIGMGDWIKELNNPAYRTIRLFLTPDMAEELLRRNKCNRLYTNKGIKRIDSQIRSGKWMFNGATIRISCEGFLLDGQNRCYAVRDTKTAIETVVVFGIERQAFPTMDAIQKLRTASDTLFIAGVKSHPGQLASALTWLLRHERGVIQEYRDPKNRIENTDVESAHRDYPDMPEIVARCMPLRGLLNPALAAFLYYVTKKNHPEIAEKMIEVFGDATQTGVNDPLVRVREHFSRSDRYHKKTSTVYSIAIAFKGINYAIDGEQVFSPLTWRYAGKKPEKFPELK